MDKRTVELLACPACRAKLQEQPQAFACSGCGRLFPMVDGIPVLTIGAARRADGKTGK